MEINFFSAINLSNEMRKLTDMFTLTSFTGKLQLILFFTYLRHELLKDTGTKLANICKLLD